jgi:ParB family transcriptional regulator, chromosome partitioning protein
LLLADDHQARRSLAREATAEGWSVRVTEAEARRTNGGDGTPDVRLARRRRRPAGVHPDAQQAAQEIADALGGALGAEVHVRPTRDGAYRAELSFSTPQEAIELARSIRAGAPA